MIPKDDYGVISSIELSMIPDGPFHKVSCICVLSVPGGSDISDFVYGPFRLGMADNVTTGNVKYGGR